ncbi:MAG: hypothetical protein RLY84_736 [Actinomycetota bacterium]|jgi:uncharacterized membrane protein YhaH (DUF805 family)
MSFADAVVSGFRNYFNFRGRASRSEFWYWFLFTILISIVATTVESVLWPVPMAQDEWLQLQNTLSQPTPITNFLAIALLVPNLSVTARRFHDAGFSAKWLILQLVPIAYAIFAAIGAISILSSSNGLLALSTEDLMSLVFLVIPIFGLFLVVMVIYLVFALKPSRSFYDGNKYVEPENPASLQEGTTA